MPPPPELTAVGREQHIDYVIRSLKVLALRRGVPVVAVEAVDERAIRRRGSVTMTYEPAVGLALNNEHLEATERDDRVRTVRLAIDKNRHSPSDVEWRHSLYGRRFYLEPEGEPVSLKESLQLERVRA